MRLASASTLRRLFAEALPPEGGTVELPAESLRHAKVLRLSVGARVCLFDGRGREAEATIVALGRAGGRCEAAPPRALPEPAPRLTLLVGLPKADKLELIVRMATELGAHALYPVSTQRSVPRTDRGRGDREPSDRLERLRRIAREACAQSGQAFAPELAPPGALLDVAARAPADTHKVVFWEHADGALITPPCDARELWAVVGPEGGLAADEVDALEALGFAPAGLGAARLRVETAALVAMTVLLDRAGRLRS